MTATVHASAVLVGARAVLIQGQAGAGKSRLVLRLLQLANTGVIWSRLVADDRVHLQALGGRILARPAPVLAGLLEVWGLGIRPFPFEAVAVVGYVIRLGAAAERLPEPRQIELLPGIALPSLSIPACADPLPVLLSALRDPELPITS